MYRFTNAPFLRLYSAKADSPSILKKSMYNSRTVAKFYSVEILQMNNYAVIVHKNFTVLKQSEYSVNITNCIELCLVSLIEP